MAAHERMRRKVFAEECVMMQPVPRTCLQSVTIKHCAKGRGRACWYAIWAALASTMKLQRGGCGGIDEKRCARVGSSGCEARGRERVVGRRRGGVRVEIGY